MLAKLYSILYYSEIPIFIFEHIMKFLLYYQYMLIIMFITLQLAQGVHENSHLIVNKNIVSVHIFKLIKMQLFCSISIIHIV